MTKKSDSRGWSYHIPLLVVKRNVGVSVNNEEARRFELVKFW